MRKNQQIKSDVVSDLTEKVKKSKAIIFADYRGLTHLQLEALRRSLKAVDADLEVAKNTLLTRAMNEGKLELEKGVLREPTITMFAFGDAILALKELYKHIKSVKLPVVKLGYFEGKAYQASDVQKLSNLPSREQLIAQLVGQMNAPLYGLHRSLNWNMQKLVLALSEVQKKKEAQAA